MIIYKTKIQQEVYSKGWCFAHSMLSCLPSWDLCKMCGRPMQKFFSWSTQHAWIFFHLIFPCMNFFFVLRPPPHNFSNGPSLITFHCLGFFHWTVFNLFFRCLTVKTIYRDCLLIFLNYWLRGHVGERINCFSKIQLVGQKYLYLAKRDSATIVLVFKAGAFRY